MGSQSERQRILQRQTFHHAQVKVGLDVVKMLQHQRTSLCRILYLQRIQEIGMIIVAAGSRHPSGRKARSPATSGRPVRP